MRNVSDKLLFLKIKLSMG